MFKRTMIAAAAASIAIVAPATAQTQNGLVNVNVGGDVLSDILTKNNISVDVSNVTVAVPISVAANVCDQTIAVLSAQRKEGGATCNAQSGSAALTRAVVKKLNRQQQ